MPRESSFNLGSFYEFLESLFPPIAPVEKEKSFIDQAKAAAANLLSSADSDDDQEDIEQASAAGQPPLYSDRIRQFLNAARCSSNPTSLSKAIAEVDAIIQSICSQPCLKVGFSTHTVSNVEQAAGVSTEFSRTLQLEDVPDEVGTRSRELMRARKELRSLQSQLESASINHEDTERLLRSEGAALSQYIRAQSAYNSLIQGVHFSLDFRAFQHDDLRLPTLYSAVVRILEEEVSDLQHQIAQKNKLIADLTKLSGLPSTSSEQKKEYKNQIAEALTVKQEREKTLKLKREQLGVIKKKLVFKSVSTSPLLRLGFHSRLGEKAVYSFKFNGNPCGQQEGVKPQKTDMVPAIGDSLFTLPPAWAAVEGLKDCNPFEFVHLNAETVDEYYSSLNDLKRALETLRKEVECYAPAKPTASVTNLFDKALNFWVRKEELLSLEELAKISREIDQRLKHVHTVQSQLIYEMGRRLRAANYAFEYRAGESTPYFFDGTDFLAYKLQHNGCWAYSVLSERELEHNLHDTKVFVVKPRFSLSTELLGNFKAKITQFQQALPREECRAIEERARFVKEACAPDIERQFSECDIIGGVHDAWLSVFVEYSELKEFNLTLEQLNEVVGKFPSARNLMNSPEFRLLFEFRQGGIYRQEENVSKLLKRYGYNHLLLKTDASDDQFIFDKACENVDLLIQNLLSTQLTADASVLNLVRSTVRAAFHPKASGERSEVRLGLDLCKQWVFDQIYDRTELSLGAFWKRMLPELYEVMQQVDIKNLSEIVQNTQLHELTKTRGQEFHAVAVSLEFLLSFSNVLNSPRKQQINIFRPILSNLKEMCGHALPQDGGEQLARRQPIETVETAVSYVFDWVLAQTGSSFPQFRSQVQQSKSILQRLFGLCKGLGFECFAGAGGDGEIQSLITQVAELYASQHFDDSKADPQETARDFLTYLVTTFVAFEVKAMLGITVSRVSKAAVRLGHAELDSFRFDSNALGKLKILLHFDQRSVYSQLIQQSLSAIAQLSKGPTAALQFLNRLLDYIEDKKAGVSSESVIKIQEDSVGRNSGEIKTYPLSDYPVNRFLNTLQIYCIAAAKPEDRDAYGNKIEDYKSQVAVLAEQLIDFYHQQYLAPNVVIQSYGLPDFHCRLIRRFVENEQMVVDYALTVFKVLLVLRVSSKNLHQQLQGQQVFNADCRPEYYANEFFLYCSDKYPAFKQGINELLLLEIKKGVFQSDLLREGIIALSLLYGDESTKWALHIQILTEFYHANNLEAKDAEIPFYFKLLQECLGQENRRELLNQGVGYLNSLLKADMSLLGERICNVHMIDNLIFGMIVNFNLTNDSLFEIFGCPIPETSLNGNRYAQGAFQFIRDARCIIRSELPSHFSDILEKRHSMQRLPLDATPYFYHKYAYDLGQGTEETDVLKIFFDFMHRFLTAEKFMPKELLPLFEHLFADPSFGASAADVVPHGHHEYSRLCAATTNFSSYVDEFRVKHSLIVFFETVDELIKGEAKTYDFQGFISIYVSGVAEIEALRIKYLDAMWITFLGSHITSICKTSSDTRSSAAEQIRALEGQLQTLKAVLEQVILACRRLNTGRYAGLQDMIKALNDHKEALDAFIASAVFFVPNIAVSDLPSQQALPLQGDARSAGPSIMLSPASATNRSFGDVSVRTVTASQGQAHPVRNDYHCVFNNGIFSVLTLKLAEAIAGYFKSYPEQLAAIEQTLQDLMAQIKKEAPLALAHIHVLTAFLQVIKGSGLHQEAKEILVGFESFHRAYSEMLLGLWKRRPVREIFSIHHGTTQAPSTLSVATLSPNNGAGQIVLEDRALLWSTVCQLATDDTVFCAEKMGMVMTRYFNEPGHNHSMAFLENLRSQGGVPGLISKVRGEVDNSHFQSATVLLNELQGLLTLHHEAFGYAIEAIAHSVLDLLMRPLLEEMRANYFTQRKGFLGLYDFLEVFISQGRDEVGVFKQILAMRHSLQQAVPVAILVQYNCLLRRQETDLSVERLNSLYSLLTNLYPPHAQIVQCYVDSMESRILDSLWSMEGKESTALHFAYPLLARVNSHSEHFRAHCTELERVSDAQGQQALFFFSERPVVRHWQSKYLELLSGAAVVVSQACFESCNLERVLRQESPLFSPIHAIIERAVSEGKEFDEALRGAGPELNFDELLQSEQALLRLLFNVLTQYKCMVLNLDEARIMDPVDQAVLAHLPAVTFAFSEFISSQCMLSRLEINASVEGNVSLSREAHNLTEPFQNHLRRFYFVFELIQRGAFAEALLQFKTLLFSLNSDGQSLSKIMECAAPKTNLLYWLGKIDEVSAGQVLNASDASAVIDHRAKFNLIDIIVSHLCQPEKQLLLDERLRPFSELLGGVDLTSEQLQERLLSSFDNIKNAFHPNLELLREIITSFEDYHALSLSLELLLKSPNNTAASEEFYNLLIERFRETFASSREQAFAILRQCTSVIVKGFTAKITEDWMIHIRALQTEVSRCLSTYGADTPTRSDSASLSVDSSSAHLNETTFELDVKTFIETVDTLEDDIKQISIVLCNDLKLLLQSIRTVLNDDEQSVADRLKNCFDTLLPELLFRVSKYPGYLSFAVRLPARIAESTRLSECPFSDAIQAMSLSLKRGHDKDLLASVFHVLSHGHLAREQNVYLNYLLLSSSDVARVLREIVITESTNLAFSVGSNDRDQNSRLLIALKIALKITVLYPSQPQSWDPLAATFSMQVRAGFLAALNTYLKKPSSEWTQTLRLVVDGVLRVYTRWIKIFKDAAPSESSQLDLECALYDYLIQRKIFETTIHRELSAFSGVFDPASNLYDPVSGHRELIKTSFELLREKFEKLLIEESAVCKLFGNQESHCIDTGLLDVQAETGYLENLRLHLVFDAFWAGYYAVGYQNLLAFFNIEVTSRGDILNPLNQLVAYYNLPETRQHLMTDFEECKKLFSLLRDHINGSKGSLGRDDFRNIFNILDLIQLLTCYVVYSHRHVNLPESPDGVIDRAILPVLKVVDPQVLFFNNLQEKQEELRRWQSSYTASMGAREQVSVLLEQILAPLLQELNSFKTQLSESVLASAQLNDSVLREVTDCLDKNQTLLASLGAAALTQEEINSPLDQLIESLDRVVNGFKDRNPNELFFYEVCLTKNRVSEMLESYQLIERLIQELDSTSSSVDPLRLLMNLLGDIKQALKFPMIMRVSEFKESVSVIIAKHFDRLVLECDTAETLAFLRELVDMFELSQNTLFKRKQLLADGHWKKVDESTRVSCDLLISGYCYERVGKEPIQEKVNQFYTEQSSRLNDALLAKSTLLTSLRNDIYTVMISEAQEGASLGSINETVGKFLRNFILSIYRSWQFGVLAYFSNSIFNKSGESFFSLAQSHSEGWSLWEIFLGENGRVSFKDRNVQLKFEHACRLASALHPKFVTVGDYPSETVGLYELFLAFKQIFDVLHENPCAVKSTNYIDMLKTFISQLASLVSLKDLVRELVGLELNKLNVDKSLSLSNLQQAIEANALELSILERYDPNLFAQLQEQCLAFPERDQKIKLEEARIRAFYNIKPLVSLTDEPLSLIHAQDGQEAAKEKVCKMSYKIRDNYDNFVKDLGLYLGLLNQWRVAADRIAQLRLAVSQELLGLNEGLAITARVVRDGFEPTVGSVDISQLLNDLRLLKSIHDQCEARPFEVLTPDLYVETRVRHQVIINQSSQQVVTGRARSVSQTSNTVAPAGETLDPALNQLRLDVSKLPETIAFGEASRKFEDLNLFMIGDREKLCDTITAGYRELLRYVQSFCNYIDVFPLNLRGHDFSVLDREIVEQLNGLRLLKGQGNLLQVLSQLLDYDLALVEQLHEDMKKQARVFQWMLAGDVFDLELEVIKTVKAYNHAREMTASGVSLTSDQLAQAVAHILYTIDMDMLSFSRDSFRFADAELALVNERIELYPVVLRRITMERPVQVGPVSDPSVINQQINHCIFISQYMFDMQTPGQLFLTDHRQSLIIQLALDLYRATLALRSLDGLVLDKSLEQITQETLTSIRPATKLEHNLFLCNYVAQYSLPEFDETTFLDRFADKLVQDRVNALDLEQEMLGQFKEYIAQRCEQLQPLFEERSPSFERWFEKQYSLLWKIFGEERCVSVLNDQHDVDLKVDLKDIIFRVFNRVRFILPKKAGEMTLDFSFSLEQFTVLMQCLSHAIQQFLLPDRNVADPDVLQEYKMRAVMLEQYLLMYCFEVIDNEGRSVFDAGSPALRHFSTILAYRAELQQFYNADVDIRFLLQELYLKLRFGVISFEEIFEPLSGERSVPMTRIIDRTFGLGVCSSTLDKSLFTAWAGSEAEDRLKSWSDLRDGIKERAAMCFELAKTHIMTSLGDQDTLIALFAKILRYHSSISIAQEPSVPMEDAASLERAGEIVRVFLEANPVVSLETLYAEINQIPGVSGTFINVQADIFFAEALTVKFLEHFNRFSPEFQRAQKMLDEIDVERQLTQQDRLILLMGDLYQDIETFKIITLYLLANRIQAPARVFEKQWIDEHLERVRQIQVELEAELAEGSLQKLLFILMQLNLALDFDSSFLLLLFEELFSQREDVLNEILNGLSFEEIDALSAGLESRDNNLQFNRALYDRMMLDMFLFEMSDDKDAIKQRVVASVARVKAAREADRAVLVRVAHTCYQDETDGSIKGRTYQAYAANNMHQSQRQDRSNLPIFKQLSGFKERMDCLKAGGKTVFSALPKAILAQLQQPRVLLRKAILDCFERLRTLKAEQSHLLAEQQSVEAKAREYALETHVNELMDLLSQDADVFAHQPRSPAARTPASSQESEDTGSIFSGLSSARPQARSTPFAESAFFSPDAQRQAGVWIKQIGSPPPAFDLNGSLHASKRLATPAQRHALVSANPRGFHANGAGTPAAGNRPAPGGAPAGASGNGFHANGRGAPATPPARTGGAGSAAVQATTPVTPVQRRNRGPEQQGQGGSQNGGPKRK